MKIKIAFALLAATLCFTTAQAKEWYEGGTLQDASISKFIFAKHDNRGY